MLNGLGFDQVGRGCTPNVCETEIRDRFYNSLGIFKSVLIPEINVVGIARMACAFTA